MAILGNTHLIAGSSETVQQVLAYLSREGISIEANPDLYVRSYAHFGIDEARELRDRAALGASSERRVFVIQAPGMTTEAQNALLKTLEEPPADAYFFLIVASPESMLTTLRSRAQILALDTASAQSSIEPRQFLMAAPAARLEMLKPLLDRDEDDRRDISGVVTFLSSLERMLSSGHHTEGLEAIYRAKKYMADKGALLKPLLEQVALVVPVIS